MSLFEEQSEVTGYQWKTETNYTSSGLIFGPGGLLERETQCNWLYISQEKTSVDRTSRFTAFTYGNAFAGNDGF